MLVRGAPGERSEVGVSGFMSGARRFDALRRVCWVGLSWVEGGGWGSGDGISRNKLFPRPVKLSKV